MNALQLLLFHILERNLFYCEETPLCTGQEDLRVRAFPYLLEQNVRPYFT